MSEWKKVLIKDLGRTVTGHTPPTKEKKYFGDFMPFVKPTDISKDEKYTYHPEQYYSREAAEKYKNSLIPKGATCVVCIGTIGEKMTMAHCDLFTNQSINSIIPSDEYDPDFVYYLLKYNLGKVKSLNKGTASGREFVSKSTFLDMPVMVCEDKGEQIRIGSVLSRYDSLIENYQQQVKLLEEAAQRLYKEWFVDLRFPGHENTKIVDGVPEGWEKTTIGEAFETLLGGTPSRQKANYWYGNIAWINSGEINKDRIIEPSEYITKEGLEHSATKLLPVHTTVLAITGATLGQVSYTEIETCANQSVVGIIDRKRNMQEYVFLYVKDNIYKIVNKATGGAQQHINKDIVNAYPFKLPTQNVVEKFNEYIRPIFKKEALIFFQIRLLTEARDRLLPKLMSGEIKV